MLFLTREISPVQRVVLLVLLVERKSGRRFTHFKTKIKRVAGDVAGISPEYEDCRTLAIKNGMTLAEVMRRVGDEARARIATPLVFEPGDFQKSNILNAIFGRFSRF